MSEDNQQNMMRFNTCHVGGLLKAIQMSIDIDWPLLILGTMGIGKSSIVHQAVQTKGGGATHTVIDGIRVSQMMPEDAGGMVTIGEMRRNVGTKDEEVLRVVDRLMPDVISKCWQQYDAHNGRPVLLFLDEFTSGTPSIMAAFYSVVLERRAAGFPLPPDTRIIAAGNTVEDRGVAYEMPKPMQNRFSTVRFLGPTWQEFERYALQVAGLHPTVMTFLKQQPEYVCGKIVVDDDEGRNPTPRTWEAVSKVLHRADEHGHDHTDRMYLVSSFIGDHAALQMEAYLRMAGKLPTFEEIMANPAKAKLEAKDVAVSYMATTLLVNRVSDKDQFKKGYDYVARMREEMMSVYLRSLMNHQSKLKLVIANREMLVKHADVLGAGSEHVYARA